MKIKCLLSLLIPVLTLVSCGSNQSITDSIPNGGEITSGIGNTTTLKEDEVAIYFYISGPSADLKNPLYSSTSIVGGRIAKPSKDPVSLDPAYNTFLGWSDKVVALSLDDIWDFDNDVVPNNLKKPEFHLYGQWDYIE